MRNPFRKPVVVTVTGAPSDAPAVRLAAAEAVLRERALHLIAAYPATTTGLSLTERWSPLGTARQTMIDALTALRAWFPRLAVECRVLPGDPGQLLVDRSPEADIVVVPAQPASSRPRARAALAERVVAHARCPVVVAHEGGQPGGPVLVALDGSPGADPLVDYAFEAAATRGVAVHPVLVWSALPGVALSAVDPFRFDTARAHAEADRLLADAVAGWSEKNPAVRVHRRDICASDAANALRKAATPAGLLVVGTRAQPVRSSLALGAVTRRLIRTASCPVAVVSRRKARP